MMRPYEMGPKVELVAASPRGGRFMPASDRFFRALIEHAGETFSVIDAEGNILHQSSDADQLVAFNPARQDTLSIFDVIHPDDADRVRAELTRCAANKKWATVEAFRILMRSGSWSWVELRLKNLLDDPEIQGILCIAHDVNETYRLEHQLREAERLAHFGRWRWVRGEHAPTWSAGIARLLDWQEEKLPQDGNWHRVLVHPEDRDELLSKFLDAFHHEGSITCVSRFRAGNGVYRYIKTHAYAELDAGGQVEAIVGLAEDVTEEIQSALALRQSEAKYRQVAERASDVIGHCAPDGTMTFLSTSIEKTLGYTQEELPTLATCNALIHQDDFARMQPSFEKFRKGGESVRLEYRFLHKQGHHIWLETNMRGLRDATTGRINELIIISRDISERKSHEMALLHARERAEEASRIKSQFLANMSHELRTPLNAIIGFSDILKMEMFGSLGNDRYKEYAQLINESGALLLDLISDILDMSKIEAGKYELHYEKLNLATIISSSTRLMSARANELGLQLIEEISEEASASPFIADERAFKQILLNLLSNALKFTPSGGQVRIIVAVRAEELILTVSDTGKGIPEDQISRLAQPFEQVSGKSEPGHQGTGLGLALVRSLAEMHGGEIRIESKLGEGTNVSVLLPLNPQPENKASA